MAQVDPRPVKVIDADLQEAFDSHDNDRIRELNEERRHAQAGENGASDWPEPEPLPALPAAPLWDEELLPEVFRPAVTDIAERMQCPPDYIAAALTVATSSVIGRTCAIRPEREDDWTVTPNLWGFACGPPSQMKTPAVNKAFAPLIRLEKDAAEAFEREALDRKTIDMELEALENQIKSEIKTSVKKGTANPKEIRENYADDYEDCVERQQELHARKRLMLHEPTIEKLGMILGENERGVLIFRDELRGFLRTLDKIGHENARAFYLEAWNGSGSYSYDRVGRGTLYIKSACVSLFGTIQPGPLQSYLNGALTGDEGDDGLIQRFQVAVYPEPVRNWKRVNRRPNREAITAMSDVFARLDDATSSSFGAVSKYDSLPFVRFDDNAQAVFDEWREELERRLRQGDEHPAFEAHLAKYRSLVPSLGLIFHLVDNESGPVQKPSIERAVKWATFLEGHARRIYASRITPEVQAAKTILAKAKAGKLESPFTLRSLYRKQWAGLTTSKLVKGGAELLVDLGWARLESVKTNGREATHVHLHPQGLKEGLLSVMSVST